MHEQPHLVLVKEYPMSNDPESMMKKKSLGLSFNTFCYLDQRSNEMKVWSRKLLGSPQTSAIDASNREAVEKSNRKNVPRRNEHEETGIKKATTASVLREDDQSRDEEQVAVNDSAVEPDAVPNKYKSYAMPTVESDVYDDRTSPSMVPLMSIPEVTIPTTKITPTIAPIA
ncbi:MAG: hypothetical protein Q9204_005767 [Flavoplaca sp. TL-2023a]